MPPTKLSDDFGWRNETAREILPDVFSKAVIDQLITRTYEAGGYIYGSLRVEADKFDFVRTPGARGKWLYQARRVNTQTNVGGGALTTRISLPAGVTARLAAGYFKGTASAGSSLSVQRQDEDGAIAGYLVSIGAGAAREATLPSVGSGATGHGNVADTSECVLGPGEYITVIASAALQNETLTTAVALLLSSPVEPTWDTTGSAGTPSLAASTISTANTLQSVIV